MAQPKDFGFGPDEQMVRDSARKLPASDDAGIETLRTLVARDHTTAYESAVQPAPWDERALAPDGRARLDRRSRCRRRPAASA